MEVGLAALACFGYQLSCARVLPTTAGEFNLAFVIGLIILRHLTVLQHSLALRQHLLMFMLFSGIT